MTSLDGVLVWIAEVHRCRVVAVHQFDQPLDQVGHILERPGLVAFAVDRNRLILQRLHDEIADHASVVRVHSGAKRVEYSGNLKGIFGAHKRPPFKNIYICICGNPNSFWFQFNLYKFIVYGLYDIGPPIHTVHLEYLLLLRCVLLRCLNESLFFFVKCMLKKLFPPALSPA